MAWGGEMTKKEAERIWWSDSFFIWEFFAGEQDNFYEILEQIRAIAKGLAD